MAKPLNRRRSERIADRRSLAQQPSQSNAATSPLGGHAVEHGQDFLNVDDNVESHKEESKLTWKRKRTHEEDDDYLPGGVVGYTHEKSQTRTLKRRGRPNYEYSEETTTEISKTTKFFKRSVTSEFGSFLTLKVPGLAQTGAKPQATAEVVDAVEAAEPVITEEENDDDWKDDDGVEEEGPEESEEKPVVRRKLAPPPPGGHLSQKYRVSFNWTPYLWHARPTPTECQQVFDILMPWTLKKNDYDITIELERITRKPLHGARGGTVHPIVNVIMSQATKNDNAIVVQNQLTKDFPYTVNGEKVVTNTPNYHDMMKLKPTELANYIRAAGFGNQRAVHILSFLNSVRKENEKVLQVDGKLPDDIETGNPPNAPDFVPGMLSLDFLNEQNKEGIFQWLLSMEGVGVKSAICVLEFDFGYPLCAVDTHVFNMASWLGWLPEECKDDIKAFCHLDARIPGPLKHALHQLFWQHMQLCVPCKRKHDKKTSLPASVEACPLEGLGIDRKPNRKKTPWKPKKDERGRIIKTETFQKSVKITKFKDAGLAAAKGYVRGVLNIHDDFDIDMTSTNIKKEERWEYVGVEEAMRANGQSSVKNFFAPINIKPEGV
ncbi:hypothetical protein DV736_g1967, partial [Chaetothyriales sp. CBS 134916]